LVIVELIGGQKIEANLELDLQEKRLPAFVGASLPFPVRIQTVALIPIIVQWISIYDAIEAQS